MSCSDMEEQICGRLARIEQEENVKILCAVESGSRAWGFASPDSDYDVRFVYIRPAREYLCLEEKKDFIDWELNETLDINGWDLPKLLRHVHKSNAAIYEWENSPIVYHAVPGWDKICEVSRGYFSCKSAIYHYYATARKNFCEYLKEEQVSYKKYFYVLRPLLACRWIEKKKCPPPVLFDRLAAETLEADMRPSVDRLLQMKRQMTEAQKGRRIDELNSYIEDRLSEYKEKLKDMKDDRNGDWEALNRLFLMCLKQYG